MTNIGYGVLRACNSYYQLKNYFRSPASISTPTSILAFMVRIEQDKLVIHLQTENPSKELAELRKAVTSVTTTLVVGDEWNFNPDLPEATASLIRLLGELVKTDN